MQIIQHRKHIDKISLQQIWCALHFINSLSSPYYDLEIGMVWVDELGGERCSQVWTEVWGPWGGGELRRKEACPDPESVWRGAVQPERYSPRRTNDHRASESEVPVRYLRRHGASSWLLNGGVRLGGGGCRFRGCRDGGRVENNF